MCSNWAPGLLQGQSAKIDHMGSSRTSMPKTATRGCFLANLSKLATRWPFQANMPKLAARGRYWAYLPNLATRGHFQANMLKLGTRGTPGPICQPGEAYGLFCPNGHGGTTGPLCPTWQPGGAPRPMCSTCFTQYDTAGTNYETICIFNCYVRTVTA